MIQLEIRFLKVPRHYQRKPVFMRKIILKLIRLYQKTKFFRGYMFRVLFISDSSCRFTPTCSDYTYQAVEKYGPLKGLFIGFTRIIRCHPWSKGGLDPIPRT